MAQRFGISCEGDGGSTMEVELVGSLDRAKAAGPRAISGTDVVTSVERFNMMSDLVRRGSPSCTCTQQPNPAKEMRLNAEQELLPLPTTAAAKWWAGH